MVYVARWTKGQSLSACYLLASTVLVMIAVFTLEDILIPAKCSSCNGNSPDRIALLVNIGKTPVIRRPEVDSSRKRSNVDRVIQRPEVDSSRKGSNVDAEDTKIYEENESAKENVSAEENESVEENESAEVSDVDLTDTLGTAAATVKESKAEKLLDSNESKVDNATKPKEDSDSEQNEGSAASPPPPPVRSAWYYTKLYNHSEAELRLLTAEDGAPRLRSNISPPDREITIVTQTSADRLPAVEATCLTWGGAIVVAVHVRLQSEFASVYEVVKQLHARVEEQSGCRLDIQFVTEDGFETDKEALNALYPVNSLRNVALGMAETKLVFLLDADFKPSPRLHESLTEDEATYEDLLRKATEERTLFVVPAFEAAPKSRRPHVGVPESMEELRKAWDEKTIDCFHCLKSSKGHKPTKFEKFFDPETTEPYPITYKDGFEPYVIAALDVIPQYDGRFRGYGENKISHLYACAADGMSFVVLPNVFVYELPHPPSKARESYIGKHKDPDQRFRIVGLYNQFRYVIWKEQMAKDPERFQEFMRTSKVVK